MPTEPAEIVPAEPYKGEMAAVDDLREGDVAVVSECGASFWGELLSTAARYRGCRGVIIDGYTRDTRAIINMGFPVFCTGIHPADSLGRLDVAEHDVPVRCGGVPKRGGARARVTLRPSQRCNRSCSMPRSPPSRRAGCSPM